MSKSATKSKSSKKLAVKTVHVTFLVDRSGSMSSIRNDVIGGFNAFLKEQQAQDGECHLTVHQFDSNGFDTLFDAKDIKTVRDATEADFQPRGSTPLLDSVGKAITHAQERCDSPEGKDEQPIVVILTDGYENASREYTRQAVKSMIEEKERVGWVFTYLGANLDAYDEAHSLGIHRGSTQNYVPDAFGTKMAMGSVSHAVSNARGMAAAGTPVSASAFYANTGKAADDDHAKRTGKTSEQKTDTSDWTK